MALATTLAKTDIATLLGLTVNELKNVRKIKFYSTEAKTYSGVTSGVQNRARIWIYDTTGAVKTVVKNITLT